jgi:hypothetical protein
MLRIVALAFAFALGCAPHGADETVATPAPTPTPTAVVVPRSPPAPPIREVALEPLARALKTFPEERQEMTLALGSRTHRCCYWGADTTGITSHDGSPVVQWVGPDVPRFVADPRDGMTLFILDPHPQGWLAFYRERYGEGGCLAADKRSRCEFGAAMYDEKGEEQWFAELDPFFTSPDLEIDDVHWHEGLLFFNETCSPVSKSKRCSAIAAYDPVRKKLRWRSANLVSNDAFRIVGDRIVAVFSVYTRTGGTGVVTVLDRARGRVLARESLAGPIDEVLVHDGVIQAEARTGTVWLEMTPGAKGLDLVLVPRPSWFAPKTVSLYR